MHIPDGIVPIAVVMGGYAVSGGVLHYSLRQINKLEDPQAAIPKASLLTAAFFVASWIHIPVPPTSVHLVLNGLLGVVLGYYAFPAIVIGLLFQAIMFQHGGLTTLGLNAAIMGLPALLAYQIFQLRHHIGQPNNDRLTALFGFLGGMLGQGFAVLLFYGILVITIPADIDATTEQTAITLLSLAHLPVMLLEGTLTAMLVLFLKRVKPELLGGIGEPIRVG
ncbi:cobalt transporter CbiM [Anaerolineales bacterium HSG6]|nr:cobalt transporter CbiM [Anaerolineales bacterium HSG6]